MSITFLALYQNGFSLLFKAQVSASLLFSLGYGRRVCVTFPAARSPTAGVSEQAGDSGASNSDGRAYAPVHCAQGQGTLTSPRPAFAGQDFSSFSDSEGVSVLT